MAEEKLTLIDGMSASLRRIYREAERLNQRMLTLKSNIKSLEKPTSLSYFRKELKDTEKQAQQTERAIKAMRSAESLNARYGAFKVGANGRYYVNGVAVPNAQAGYMAESYARNVMNGQIRRNRLLWENGRILNGMTFDQRYAKLHPFKNFANTISARPEILASLSSSSQTLSSKFLDLVNISSMLTGVFVGLTRTANNVFLKPQSEYISNLTRVALTNDKTKTPKQMMDELYDTASRTRAPADATFMLYNRIALSGVKASNERIRRFVESFNKVTAISGTTGQENRAVMLQLAQGMGSNRLGGDEFRSISEQAPLFKFMLARGLGVNPGALKQMGAEGKLTAEAIMKAMEKTQDQIDEIYKEAPLTIGQSIIILQNKWDKLINNQFTGYLAIRDLIKDITLWMDTPKGKEVISTIIKGWNKFLMGTVSLIKQIAPFVIWFIQHLKQITIIIGSLIIATNLLKMAFGAFKLLIIGFQLYGWFMSATEGAIMLRTALSGIGPVILSWLGPLSTVLLAIGTVVASIMAVKKLQGYFDPEKIRNEQRNKDAFFKFENAIDDYIKTKYPSYDVVENPNNRVPLNAKMQADMAKRNEERAKALETKDYLIYKFNEAQKRGVLLQFKPKMMDEFSLSGIRGMADSDANVPMVGKVKEVGKIDDKISLDNDGIEMMKAIAERQWVMQNEVTVPQNVNIEVTKEADIDEEKLKQSLTNGMKLAVASSMRGYS